MIEEGGDLVLGDVMVHRSECLMSDSVSEKVREMGSGGMYFELEENEGNLEGKPLSPSPLSFKKSALLLFN